MTLGRHPVTTPTTHRVRIELCSAPAPDPDNEQDTDLYDPTRLGEAA